MSIRPIKPRRISTQVFEQLRELIYKGVYKPGQQIPPERELANSMEVSRTSVRNAISKLDKLGLLQQIQGQGTFVSSPDIRRGNQLSSAMSTDEATYLDLLETRMGLECNAAFIAAGRATKRDLGTMELSLKEMEEDFAIDGTITTDADTAFHMSIILSTKNPVLIHLARTFYDFLFVGIKKNLAHLKDHDFAYEDVLEHHQNIFVHIKNQHPQKAHDAMRLHLLYVQNFFENRKTTFDTIPIEYLAA